MTQPQMDEQSRNLILAAEISGLLHDLGKLRPEFAAEGMKGGQNLSDQVESLGIGAAHGAILEDGSPYPSAQEKAEDWLKMIKQHAGWAKILELPKEWANTGTVQARGLGDPLRQHHATGSTIAGDIPALLGDIYALGADTRDSAFDKGSGYAKSGKQRLQYGFIADSFGNENITKTYSPECLHGPWLEAKEVITNTLLKDDAWRNISKVRKDFIKGIKDIFSKALGETRRPTNDVTLWHHSYSAASLFKAAVAECVLRKDFKCWQRDNGHLYAERMSRIRFRLLGIRWDWALLAGSALQPVILTALAENRRRAIANLRRRLEVDCPIGNLIYEDDNGAVFVVGGFYKDPMDIDGKESEALFQDNILNLLQYGILQDLNPLGAGVTVRLAWTQPRLYLTDYREVMATDWLGTSENRQRLLQIGESELMDLWRKKATEGQQVQICPQCGLRPGQARELAINQSGLSADEDDSPTGLCDFCQTTVAKSAYAQRRREASNLFGFEPHNFNLQEISNKQNLPSNSRMIMLSVKINTDILATSESLLTQLARPFSDIEGLPGNINSIEIAGRYLQDVINILGQQPNNIAERITRRTAGRARRLVGDRYWLDFHPEEPDNIDFRSESDNSAQKSLDVIEEFFLREFIPNNIGLYRHDGDKLLLFGMRKHASPGRLARTWDDLRALWQQILWDIAGDTQQWLMPLSLDAGGFRVIVAANDARKALGRIQQRVNERLNKVRAGLDVHVSALAFREKFPLYIALDALRRMEQRVTNIRPQNWTLRSAFKRKHDGTPASQPDDRVREVVLDWDTEQGPVKWTVNLRTGDPEQTDLWYPHAICISRPEGPGRLVRLDQLEPGETIRLRPSTFDFIALDGTARRFDLRYDENGRRPHFILGEPGRRPYLLEQLDELLDLPRQTRWDASRTKGLLGQIIECYEKWVRDVPAKSRADGLEAWRGHCTAIFRRYLKDQPGVRDRLIALLQHEEQICLLFDAFEWSGFIEKDAHSRVEEPELA